MTQLFFWLRLSALSALWLCSASAFAQDQYDSLRQDLQQKKPASSYIASTRMESEEPPLSLNEHVNEIRNECRANPKAQKCLDYKRMFDVRELRDFCHLNPLDRKCRMMQDAKFNRMLKRQAKCHGGMQDRHCRIAHMSARQHELLRRER